ncbi:hypothetical protein GQ44DRAFT_704023 [Phaeosphaeriaceae sp. PMI808]|nr:hypothetical protein GQ44DRAFT_704023 [Phaeosphaeriaceae sp. PMI808]
MPLLCMLSTSIHNSYILSAAKKSSTAHNEELLCAEFSCLKPFSCLKNFKAHVENHTKAMWKCTCHERLYSPARFNEHMKRQKQRQARSQKISKHTIEPENSNGVLLSARRLSPVPAPNMTYASGIDAIYQEQKQGWLPYYEVLKSIRHKTSALANFLSTENVDLQASLTPFLDGIRSGRLHLLSQAEVESHVSEMEMGSPRIFPVQAVYF